jgi:putative transposase
MRRRIHTHVKILEYLGALPACLRDSIHTAQLNRYRQLNPEEYFGHDLADLFDKEITWIRQFGDFPTAKKLSVGILKLFVFFRSVMSKVRGFKSAIRKEKFFFVELAQRYKKNIPVYTFSRLIGLDESTLRNWIRQVRIRCSDSVINVCRRVHPNQLLVPEINKMKILLSDDEFRFWPLSSLYYFALKNKIVSMSKSTWYKYAAILCIKRLKPKTVKLKRSGIRASLPNELWHADVTYFFTPERVKLYIYTVIDNFSRFPLCVMVSDRLCGRIRVESFREALKKAIEISPSADTLQLMTDGGSENFNGNVSDFMNTIESFEIKHIKALSDGWPSNSMVEAFHYVLKIFYLNHMGIRNLQALNKALEFIVKDYAYKRPHGTLKGLTPYQAYTGHRPEEVSFAPQLQKAREIRIIINQSHNCSGKCHL